MTQPSHAQLQSQIAVIQKTLEDVVRRLEHMEERQDKLFELANLGRGGLRLLLRVGIVLGFFATIGVAIYSGLQR